MHNLPLSPDTCTGQDVAHYFTGEKTFQSTYSNESLLSVESAMTWVANFSRHTFFLLPLTAEAAARVLLPPGSAARSLLAGDDGGLLSPPPAWLVSFRDNAWVLAALSLWVAGCYALDSDSGPLPWMMVKQRVLGVKLGAAGLRKDLAAIRRWAVGHRPSRDTTTHWWFADLAGGQAGEADAFSRLAECSEVCHMNRLLQNVNLWYATLPLYFSAGVQRLKGWGEIKFPSVF